MAAGPDWRAAERPPLALPAAVVATYAAYLRDRFPRATRGRLDVVVREVSDAFTADRSALPGSYLNQPPVRSAYLAHFHPQQVLRGVAALEETFVRARTRGLAPAGAVRVADLGAGLGAMSQALLLAPAAPPVAELVLVDHQRSAVQDARELTLHVHGAVHGADAPAPRVRTAADRIGPWLQRARDAGWTYDVVLLGAVLNEVRGPWEPIVAGVREILAPGGIVVVVEAALDEVARRLMALRETLIHDPAGAVTTLAPCTHDAACPLLALRRDWCFTVRPAALPDDVVRRAQLLGHQTEQIRYALWSFASTAVGRGPETGRARVVSDPMDGEHVLCTADGRERVRAIPRALRGDLAEPVSPRRSAP